MAKPNTALITGNSSGLGRGLTQTLLEAGWTVYGCSRRGYGETPAGLHDARCDLSDLDALPATLSALLESAERLDLVILNAGLLGEIRPVSETPLADMQRLMDVNAWANKVVLDWLKAWGRPVSQVVAISSGAAVLGNKGWGGYALSKAALNMLVRLYAHEFPDTHLSALAPGLIDSAMMDYLCETPDPREFPALQRIRDARGTERMPGPREAAARVIEVLPALCGEPSGEFVDIRKLLAPDEYEALMQARSRPATRP
jgi:NAD(P)-dependent dehydrogenase (short-subunit alcohol dehydrogenase family)